MIKKIKNRLYDILRWSEKYTKTDMVYLASGGFWVNLNTIISNIFALMLSLAFARFVSKDTYGTYQFLISLSSIIGGFTLMGMNNAVTQAVARGFEGTFQASIKEQIRFSLIPFIVGLCISLYYFLAGNNTISISILIIAILLPITNTLNTWTAFLNGKKDFKNIFLFSQIINILYYAGLTSIIFIKPQVLPFILISFLLNTLANILIYRLILSKYQPNNKNDAEAIKFGKKLSISNILPTIATNIDNLVIFHFLGAAQLAVYVFASSIPERLGSLLRPISNVAFPKMSTKKPEEIASIIPKKTLQLFLLSLTGGAIYVIFAPLIFKILFPTYTSSIVYSQVYTFATILHITTSFPLTALYATLSKKIYNINLSYPIYNIIFIYSGAYFFGIWGVIFAKIASNTILLAQAQYYTKK